jgi:hypothetical protein
LDKAEGVFGIVIFVSFRAAVQKFPGASQILQCLFHKILLIFVLYLQSLMSLMPQSPGRINNSDRFIPSRAGNNWQTKFAMITVGVFTDL